MKGFNPEKSEKEGIEFIIMIKAFDQSTGQILYARHSYFHNELKWGRKFFPIMEITQDERRIVDLGKLSETAPAELKS